jgi:hypothetical protein
MPILALPFPTLSSYHVVLSTQYTLTPPCPTSPRTDTTSFTATEVTGTAGKLTVNAQPTLNLVNIHEAGGIRREVPQHYYGRFRDAFITEANEFTACCLDDTKPPIRLEGAVTALIIGHALQESMITGKKIDFDRTGQRIRHYGQDQAQQKGRELQPRL